LALDPSILAAFAGAPVQRGVAGPQQFFRAAGASNNPYGRWWFESGLLVGAWKQFDRIPLPRAHRQEAILGHIRAATAVSVDWNTLSEFWVLDLPKGESLAAWVGAAAEQPVLSSKSPLHNATLRLAGGATQYYFPVLNPLWVTRFGSYFDL
jgi:hypothetical protein